MPYHFKFEIDDGMNENRPVNEQWNDEAAMFEYAAALVEQRHKELVPESTGPTYVYRAARLWEYAADCLFHASARTIGHKKSDRYDERRDHAMREARRLYAEYRTLTTYGRIPGE